MPLHSTQHCSSFMTDAVGLTPTSRMLLYHMMSTTKLSWSSWSMKRTY
jgi:hypothetical protein